MKNFFYNSSHPLLAPNVTTASKNDSICHEEREIDKAIVTVICGIGVVLLGALSNALIIRVSWSVRHKSRHKSVLLITSLAANDLLCFAFLVAIILFMLAPCLETQTSNLVLTSIHIFLHFNSQFHTSTVSMERAFAVLSPFRHRVYVTKNMIVGIIVGLWSSSFVLFVVFLVQIDHDYAHLEVLIWTLVTLGFPIPFAAVIISYTAIAIKSCQRVKERRRALHLINANCAKERQISDELRIAFNVSMLVVPMTICWSLFFIVIIYEEVTQTYITGWKYYVMTFLPFFACALNPLMYIISTRSLRKKLRVKSLRIKLGKKFSSRTSRDQETFALTDIQTDKTGLQNNNALEKVC